VIGMTQARAEEVLSAAGFVVGVTVTPSTQPPGTVIYQTPAAGTEAYQTSPVTITVSMAESPSP
jgi:beta-lactam-binding protein with PASTA domain